MSVSDPNSDGVRHGGIREIWIMKLFRFPTTPPQHKRPARDGHRARFLPCGHLGASGAEIAMLWLLAGLLCPAPPARGPEHPKAYDLDGCPI